MQYDTLKGIGRVRTHKAPSPRHIVNYVNAHYPQIIQEAEAAFMPLKYPLSGIEDIRNLVYSSYEEADLLGAFTRRDIVLGTVVLMYSKLPYGKVKNHFLHDGVLRTTARVVGQQPPNCSDDLDRAATWLQVEGIYKMFRHVCEWVKAEVCRDTDFI